MREMGESGGDMGDIGERCETSGYGRHISRGIKLFALRIIPCLSNSHGIMEYTSPKIRELVTYKLDLYSEEWKVSAPGARLISQWFYHS